MFKTKSTKSCNFSLILSSDIFALKTLPWSMFLGFKNFSKKISPGNLVWRLIGGGWSSNADSRFQRLIFPEESSNSFPISGSQNSWNHNILLHNAWKKAIYQLSNTFWLSKFEIKYNSMISLEWLTLYLLEWDWSNWKPLFGFLDFVNNVFDFL